MASPNFNSNFNVEVSRLSEFSFGLPGRAETTFQVPDQQSLQAVRARARKKSTAGEVILAFVFLGAAVASILGVNSKMLAQEFPGVAAVLHLSAPLHQAVPAADANAGIRVWVDRNTALYYCPGSAVYGRTRNGQYLSQAEARLENFEPAMRKACTMASMAMLRKDQAHR